MTAKTYTPKQVAEDLGTDGKTFRKYLRSVTPKDEQPGKGNRWSLSSKQVRDAKKGFKAWDQKRQAPTNNEDGTPTDAEVSTANGEDVDEVLNDELDAEVEEITLEDDVDDEDFIDDSDEEVDLDDEGNPVELDV